MVGSRGTGQWVSSKGMGQGWLVVGVWDRVGW